MQNNKGGLPIYSVAPNELERVNIARDQWNLCAFKI